MSDPAVLAAELADWLVGAAFGRFDVRLATGERAAPAEPEPFDPLPVCSPGMLTDERGLPAGAPPAGYPLDLPADGILVDDSGLGGTPARADMVRRVRHVLEVVFRDQATVIEAELCGLLGVRELRDYLGRPSLYFGDHLSRYSKSRRKAPICWPLSTESGGYTVWLYYPRLTDDTLHRVVAEHVAPKVTEVEDAIARLSGEQTSGGRGAAGAARELSRLTGLLVELRAFREEVLRVAKLPYRPDLNDGVQITAAPLWRLFRLPKWRKELEATWKALEAGKYDWAHLACTVWPDRVREKCRSDRSLAIAHGLESLYEPPPPAAKGPRRGARR